jgi:hypothetical protein
MTGAQSIAGTVAQAAPSGKPGRHPMPEEPETILLGEYEIPDAQRMLAGLEAAQIFFEIDPVDQRTRIPSKGAGGRYSRMQIWIRPADCETARVIQAQCLKIEL